MPGIVGIVDSQGTISESRKIQQMIQPLRRQEWHTAEVREIRRARLGAVTIDSEPRIAQGDGLTLAWAGEIVQQDAVRGQVRQTVPSEAPFAEILLRRVQEAGPQALCGLNGIYAVAVWDERNERLHLINDRYGLQKIYLHSGKGFFAFSSEMKSFFEPSRQISTLGAAQLLSLGYLLDDETLYHDVKLLPPASLLTYEQDRWTVETYWLHNFNRGETSHTTREYLAGLTERARAAVARRVQPDSAILITGGLDSRLLAGLWAEAAPASSAEAISLGQPHASDVITGREVASALGFPFLHIPLTPAYLANFAEQCVWVTDGNMNVYASWILAANNAFRPRGIRYALTGVGGEAVAGRHLLFEPLPHSLEEGVDPFLQSLNLPRIGSLLRKEIAGDLMEHISAAVQRTVREAPAEHHLDKLDYYSYHQSLRRHATSVDVFADYAHPLDPLLDNDLIDYVQTIPPKLRARAYLYRRMIRKTLPHIASIGSALRGPLLRPSLEKSLSTVTGFSRRAERRIRRMATTITAADNPLGYIYPNAWLRSGSKSFAMTVFGQADRLAHLLDLDAVHSVVDAHMSGQRNDYVLLCGLMTLILWQKMFVDGDPSPLSDREGYITLPVKPMI